MSHCLSILSENSGKVVRFCTTLAKICPSKKKKHLFAQYQSWLRVQGVQKGRGGI
jgi:hypothetical protein